MTSRNSLKCNVCGMTLYVGYNQSKVVDGTGSGKSHKCITKALKEKKIYSTRDDILYGICRCLHSKQNHEEGFWGRKRCIQCRCPKYKEIGKFTQVAATKMGVV